MALFGSSTVFELDVRQLEGLADKLSQLSGEQLQKMNVEVVNAVALRAEITLRKYVLADVNIKPAYYDSKTACDRRSRAAVSRRRASTHSRVIAATGETGSHSSIRSNSCKRSRSLIGRKATHSAGSRRVAARQGSPCKS
jgi:hypothetical protein